MNSDVIHNIWTCVVVFDPDNVKVWNDNIMTMRAVNRIYLMMFWIATPILILDLIKQDLYEDVLFHQVTICVLYNLVIADRRTCPGPLYS